MCRQWPIFPARLQASIFGSAELNFCVRNGNRWTLCGNITDFAFPLEKAFVFFAKTSRLLGGVFFARKIRQFQKARFLKLSEDRSLLLSNGISNDLSSRLVSKQVFSAQQSLTSVFGMGTGGPSAVISLIEQISLLVHLRGLEPRTHWLRVSCSTNWAKGANLF